MDRAGTNIRADLVKVSEIFRRDQSATSWKRCFDLLVDLAAKFDEFFIIIDALDECEDEQRKRLID
jgi:hypothetical protein